MADFPSAVKTYTTKLDDDTIEASHVNDMQSEITAIETELKNGLTNPVIANAGVKFPAVAVPAADVNTLDEYQEGTFVPTIGGSGGQSGQVYSDGQANYVKIGKIVWFAGRVTLSTKGTITGDVQIKGLPYPVAGYGGITIPYFGNLTNAFCSLGGVGVGSVITLYGVKTAAATTASAVATGDLSNTTDLVFMGSYIADA